MPFEDFTIQISTQLHFYQLTQGLTLIKIYDHGMKLPFSRMKIPVCITKLAGIKTLKFPPFGSHTHIMLLERANTSTADPYTNQILAKQQ